MLLGVNLGLVVQVHLVGVGNRALRKGGGHRLLHLLLRRLDAGDVVRLGGLQGLTVGCVHMWLAARDLGAAKHA